MIRSKPTSTASRQLPASIPIFSAVLAAVVCLLLLSSCSSETDKRKEEIHYKVGQLFMLAFTGKDSVEVSKFIKDYGIGGLYLSNDNLQKPAEAAQLLNALQTAAMTSGNKLPLLTAADQEGAWAVMSPYSSPGPGNMALGAADPRFTKAMYSVYAKELSSIGVFCDLAPASDVNSNPKNPIIGTRSFGENPKLVTERVLAAIEGLHENDVIAASKHFPGHGNTASDSHSGLPRVTRSRAEIDSIDLVPFKAAVKAGVDMVMTAHIFFDAFDPKNPATLSSKILTDYLRGDLGFKGVIITDSYNMDAIRKNYNSADAAVATIKAGADMILLSEERYGDDVGDYRKSQIEILVRMEKAVLDGEISMERLNESFERIKALKEKYKLASRLPVDVAKAEQIVGSAENKAVEMDAARAAVNLIYDKKKIIPVKPKTPLYVTRLVEEDIYKVMNSSRGIGPNYADGYTDFIKTLKENKFNVIEFKPGDAVPANAVIIAISENYPLPGKSLNTLAQRNRLAQLKKTYKVPLVSVALRDPYDAYLVNPDAYISAIGSNRSNAVAAAELVIGKITSKSKLPVTPLKP